MLGSGTKWGGSHCSGYQVHCSSSKFFRKFSITLKICTQAKKDDRKLNRVALMVSVKGIKMSDLETGNIKFDFSIYRLDMVKILTTMKVRVWNIQDYQGSGKTNKAVFFHLLLV